jgi:hypothetical protein
MGARWGVLMRTACALHYALAHVPARVWVGPPTLDDECVVLLVALDGHRQVARRSAGRQAAPATHPPSTK